MNSLSWKSSEIYKTSSSVVKPGVYTGVDGKPTPITKEDVRLAHENIDDHIPFYLTHEKLGDPSRKNIGYGFKFALDEEIFDLAHNGFVFDQKAKQKIVMEGYDHISPELEFVYEGDKVVDVKLVGMAFVKDPAIDGNNVNVVITAFSKPVEEPVDMNDVDKFLKSKGLTDKEILTVSKAFSAVVEPPVTTDVSSTPPVVATPPTPVVADIPLVEPKVTDKPVASNPPTAPTISVEDFEMMKQTIDSLKADNEKMLENQYSSIVNELKGLGVANPGTIVAGLDPKQKIATLTKIKENIAKSGSLMQPPVNIGASATSTENQQELQIREACKDIGITYEQYKELYK